MDFFTHFTHEKPPQNNFSRHNFSVENNYSLLTKMFTFTLYLFTYSCNEFINTLDVYSNSNDVFDRPNASLFGLLKAKAVPLADLLLAPVSENKN